MMRSHRLDAHLLGIIVHILEYLNMSKTIISADVLVLIQTVFIYYADFQMIVDMGTP